MAKVNFRLVMPERELLAIEADMVVVPGSEGDFSVLEGHAPFMSTIRDGAVQVRRHWQRGLLRRAHPTYSELDL